MMRPLSSLRFSRTPLLLSFLTVLLAWSHAARAAPLSIAELDALASYVDCTESCEQASAVDRQLCIAGCGQAAVVWEKDGVAPVNRTDLELARLEIADDGAGTEICYRDGGIVVPAPLCAGDVCLAMPVCDAQDCAAPEGSRHPACLPAVCAALPQRTDADCFDDDWDGIPAWLERLAGTSDNEPAELCASDATCDFNHLCRRDIGLGANLCEARECPDTGCTVFHLETVSVDDQQLLVHVVFDHAITPPRVLDLHIEYDRTALILAEARPLPNLLAFGKELHSSHTAGGLLRLSVLDRLQGRAVPTGPIVELVFQRVSDDPTTVRFSTQDSLQEASMAPRQGDRQPELRNDTLWGPPVEVGPREDARGSRLLLWYSFDDENAPAAWMNVPSAAEICAREPDCANESDPVERARRVARIAALQRGQLTSVSKIDGVNRGGAWFDGANGHLRLPLQILEPYEAAGQSFSWSTWFFTEGPGPDDDPSRPQVLFAHVATDERTRFGLVLNPDGNGAYDLSFFQGDLLAPHTVERRTFLRGIPERQWRHVGFALDAAAGTIELYADGVLTGTATFPTSPPPIYCPQFARGSDVLLSQEGDFLGGQPGETLWFAPRRGPTHRLEAMDVNGLSPRVILEEGAYGFRDVDYLPVLDLIAYSSNVTGNWEIWIANGDGTDARQLTLGFGDSFRDIAARRPRWAPDGSALLFESNVFDVASGHNPSRTSQIYYVAFDAGSGEPAIPMEDGGTATQLDYALHAAAQSIGGYQVTRGDGNATNPFWLTGRGQGGERGQVVYELADERYRGNRIRRIALPDNLRDGVSDGIAGIAGPDDETRLLAAARRVRPGIRPIETVPVVYERFRVSWERSTSFTAAAVERAGHAEVTLSHQTLGFSEGCWDTNRNRLDDFEEDRNGDGVWDVNDCASSEIHNLYVRYDASTYEPRISEADAAAAVVGGQLEGTTKIASLSTVITDEGHYVRVEVDSPANDHPVPAGRLLRLRFDRKTAGAAKVPFDVVERHARGEVFVKDLASLEPPVKFDLAGRLESVEEAALSPDADRIVFYGISQARPVLVRSRNLKTLADADRLLDSPVRVSGLRWTREDRYLPCNWTGAFRHPTTRLMLNGLRGGLDDLRVYAGLRDPDSFRSEADRGRERLVADGRNDGIDPTQSPCARVTDCDPFHVCDAGVCRLAACDPQDPYACVDQGGACALRPVSVRSGDGSSEQLRFVCTAECTIDNQCYTEACANGPCLFCAQETGSCVECRNVVLDYGEFRVASTEGCPDRNGWRCESGSCVSECYSVRDGKSIYRCDATLESCVQGRCVPLKWDWDDFAPASFGGLSETQYTNIPGARRTIAVGETTTIAFEAWGREDYGRPPEVLVEARIEADGRSLYDGEWFVVNRVLVHNRNEAQARANPYVLHVPHPISDLRMRLVNSPYGDLNAGATGLGPRDKDFCTDDAIRAGADPSACTHRPPGSAFHLGYTGVVTDEERADACRNAQGPGCLNTGDGTREYLPPGRNGVAVLRVFVNNSTVNAFENPICSWEGTLDPVEPVTGRQRKLFYGDIAREQSPEKDAFCEANPAACSGAGLVDFTSRSGGSWALLNCNYRDDAGFESAYARFLVPPYLQLFSKGAVRETADACWVELDALRREQCYEFIGSEAGTDVLTAGMELFQTLEVTLPRSFGHDRGFTGVPMPRFPVVARITGLSGDGLVLSADGQRLEVHGSGTVSVEFPDKLPPGRRFQVGLESQPQGAYSSLCAVVGPERREMGSGGVFIDVSCVPSGRVGGTVSGLTGGRVALGLRAQAGEVGTRLAAVDLDEVLVGNGAFTFPRRLVAQSTYEVVVVESPRAPPQHCSVTVAEQGSVGQGISSDVRVRCVPLAPRPLGGTVQGLKGTGLVLLNSATHERLTVSGPTFRFQRLVPPGVPFSVSVVSEPADPAQFCQVLGGSGVMPNYDLLDVSVSCADRPVYRVRPRVVGLKGRGLVLSLNGSELLPVAEDGDYTFQTPLLPGAAFAVAVHKAPALPDQSCEVIAGDGTMGDEDWIDTHIICSDTLNPPDEYAVGGIVRGLVGSGLVLTLGGQSVEINENGAFEFRDPVPDRQDYEVKVRLSCPAATPDNPNPTCDPTTTPPQNCVVARGRGRVSGADVTNVEVSCSPYSTVTLAMTTGVSRPVAMRGTLVGPGGRALGELHPNATLAANGGTFPVYFKGRASRPNEPPAVLAAGDYSLYLWINDNDSRDDDGNPTYTAGDLALRHDFALAESENLTLSLTPGQFGRAVEEPVVLRSGTIEPDASVMCWWMHPTGDAPGIPVSGAIGTSQLDCTPDRAPCFNHSAAIGARQALTHRNAPLPSGLYDVICWWDANQDNTLNAGDLTGFLPGMTADGPGVLNAQTNMNLSAP